MTNAGNQDDPAGFPIRGWLAECSTEFRREFLELGRPKSFSAGSLLYRTDDAAAEMFGIMSGVVTVQCRFAHPDAVLLHLLWPGEWFGTLDLLIREASARCAAALLRLADRRWATGPHGDLPSEIPAASQTELAMLCNVSRKTFSRVIGEFSRRRLVTVGYRSLTVHDPAQLRIVADSG